jgi:heat shock protein HslJ
MYRYILIGVTALALSVGVSWLITKPDIKEQAGEVVAPPEISSTPIAFISVETGDSIFVTFGTSTALLNGNGYSNLLFTQVEAASGAKYENSSENLSLWNKGAEVTLTRGRKIIFVGKNQETYLPSDAATSTSITATTTGAVALSGTWIWVETIKGDATIIPKKPGVFSVTISEERISGTTDCNGFSGTYTRDDDTLSVGALAMTKMFCEGSQEMEFTQQFVGSLTASQSGTTLTLTHTDGTINKFEASR